MGDVQVANCFFKKRSRCSRRRCCWLSSAVSTVDNHTLLKESDSKATWGTLEILRNCILVRTVYMTHSSLAKQSYFEMNCFAINMIGVCWLQNSVFRLRILLSDSLFFGLSIGWKSILASVRFSLNFSLFNSFTNANDDLSILISILLFQSFNSPKAEFKSLPSRFGRQMNFTCPSTRVCLLNIYKVLKHKYLFNNNVFLFKKAYHCHLSVTWLRMNISKN